MPATVLTVLVRLIYHGDRRSVKPGKGRKIRIFSVKLDEIRRIRIFIFTTDDVEGNEKRVSVNYDHLTEEL